MKTKNICCTVLVTMLAVWTTWSFACEHGYANGGLDAQNDCPQPKPKIVMRHHVKNDVTAMSWEQRR